MVEILKLKNVTEALKQNIFFFRGQNPGSTAGEVRNVKSIALDSKEISKIRKNLSFWTELSL